MVHKSAKPLPAPFQWILDNYPIAVIAEYVGLSIDAIVWCEGNKVGTVEDLRSKLRRPAAYRCTDEIRNELTRLLTPPGLPIEWPQHPVPRCRAEQHTAHLPGGLRGKLNDLFWFAKDPWEAILYLIHFEEDFSQYNGIGPSREPKVRLWRDEMRKLTLRPEKILTPASLEKEELDIRRSESSTRTSASFVPSESRPPGSHITMVIHLDLDDPNLQEKLWALRQIIK